MPKIKLPAEIASISEGMIFVESWMKKRHITHKAMIEAQLMVEEWFVKMVEAAPEGAQIQIQAQLVHGVPRITLSALGERIDMDEDDIQLNLSADDDSAASIHMIRAMLIQAYRDKVSYTHDGEMNYLQVTAASKAHVFLFRCIIAFLAAIISALVLIVILPTNISEFLQESILVPLQSIYLNALQMLAAPAIFFSLMTTVTKYSAISYSRRSTIKMLFGFLSSSVIAVFIGDFLYNEIQPLENLSGFFSQLLSISDVSEDMTILERIVKFIPGNIIEPFYNTDAMQLLCMALLCGLALRKAGQYSTMLLEFAAALNKFFSAATEIVSLATPFVIFFSTILMMTSYQSTSLRLALVILLITVLGLVAMMLIYMLSILLVGRLNPIPFIRKCLPCLRTVFLSGSTVDCIPDAMGCCEKDLGISPKITSFSIPLGAVVNMDGNCVYLTIVCLIMARIHGCNLFETDGFTTVLTIIILSVACNITPGSAVLALAMLIQQKGIPLESISIVLGVNAIIEMLMAVCSTMSAIAVTTIVARSEKLIDLDVYRKKPKGRKKSKARV